MASRCICALYFLASRTPHSSFRSGKKSRMGMTITFVRLSIEPGLAVNTGQFVFWASTSGEMARKGGQWRGGEKTHPRGAVFFAMTTKARVTDFSGSVIIRVTRNPVQTY